MEKVNRYEFEGVVVEIPLRWDERSRQFVEDYCDFIENPVRTPAGCPILLTIEDACPHADLVDDGICRSRRTGQRHCHKRKRAVRTPHPA